MKRLSFILRIIFGVLVALLALVFTVIETSLFVTLDFTLYENGFLAFIQLLLKLMIAVYAGVIGVMSIVKRTRSLILESTCLLIATAVMIPFITNYIGIYITAAAVLFMLSNLLFFKTAK